MNVITNSSIDYARMRVENIGAVLFVNMESALLKSIEHHDSYVRRWELNWIIARHGLKLLKKKSFRYCQSMTKWFSRSTNIAEKQGDPVPSREMTGLVAYLVDEVARVWIIVVGGLRTAGILTPLLSVTPLLKLTPLVRGRLDDIKGSVVFTCEKGCVKYCV